MSTKPAAGTRATGTFEVKVTPVWREEGEGAALARLSLDKTFTGDLVSEVPDSGAGNCAGCAAL